MAKRVKGHFWVYDQNQQGSFGYMTKSLKNMESLLSKSEMAFTEFLALSFGQKRATHSRNTFSFFKWSTLAQKKGTFFTFKGSGVAPLVP